MASWQVLESYFWTEFSQKNYSYNGTGNSYFCLKQLPLLPIQIFHDRLKACPSQWNRRDQRGIPDSRKFCAAGRLLSALLAMWMGWISWCYLVAQYYGSYAGADFFFKSNWSWVIRLFFQSSSNFPKCLPNRRENDPFRKQRCRISPGIGLIWPIHRQWWIMSTGEISSNFWSDFFGDGKGGIQSNPKGPTFQSGENYEHYCRPMTFDQECDSDIFVVSNIVLGRLWGISPKSSLLQSSEMVNSENETLAPIRQNIDFGEVVNIRLGQT